jgi:hypothetical protein
MFKLIQQYELVGLDRVWYRPRAFGDRQADGTWDGWLVFFPVSGGRAIASDRETTQATLDALAVWASSVTLVYLEGALARALRIDQQPSIIDQLNAAEYEALLDADQLETAAQIDHAAAAAARGDAERPDESALRQRVRSRRTKRRRPTSMWNYTKPRHGNRAPLLPLRDVAADRRKPEPRDRAVRKAALPKRSDSRDGSSILASGAHDKYPQKFVVKWPA